MNISDVGESISQVMQSNSVYGGAAATVVLTRFFVWMKDRASHIDQANSEYADILTNYIVCGQNPTVSELSRFKEILALKWKIHSSRIESIGEALVRVFCTYMANPMLTRSQRDQFRYNFKVYGQKYRDRMIPTSIKKRGPLREWGVTIVFIFSVWMLDNFFFLHVDLSALDIVLLACLAGAFSAAGNLLSNIIIYYRWEWQRKRKEEKAWSMIRELCQ